VTRVLLREVFGFETLSPDPGLIPGMESLTNGDVSRKRTMLKEVHCYTLHTLVILLNRRADDKWMLESLLRAV
jgi:hypothetical protein